MLVRELYKIPLEGDEEVVSATYFRDSVIIVTNRGRIYKIEGLEGP